MTGPGRDYDDILARALHEAVDAFEPSGDALEKIRRRTAEPWLLRRLHLLLADCRDLAWLIATRLAPHLAGARSRLRPVTSAFARLAGVPRHDSAHRSPPAGRGRWFPWHSPAVGWLRPVLAVATAVIIVVAGVFGLSQLRQTVSQIGLITHPSASPSATHAPASAATHHHHSPRGHGHTRHSSPPAITTDPTVAPTPTATCHSAKATTQAATPTPSASATPDPTPTATATPAATATPTTAVPTATGTPQPTATSAQAPAPSISSQPGPAVTVSPTATATHSAATSKPCAQTRPLNSSSP